MTLEDASKVLATCSSLFETLPRIAVADRIIRKALISFEGNTEYENVYAKVLLVNALYGTQIWATAAIADHILSLELDSRLAAGDLSLVDDIRLGHRILIRSSGKERNFYSFATKYCSFHAPEFFPLVDGLVRRLLLEFNSSLGFTSSFSQKDLESYPVYTRIVTELSEKLGLESMQFKKLDQGLWLLAKWRYANSQLRNDEIAKIESVLTSLPGIARLF